MDYYKLISSKIESNNNYSLDQISTFYDDLFPYEEYLESSKLSLDDKILKYITYMAQSAKILKYIKARLDLVDDLDNYLMNKKILSSHLKAIIESNTIDLTNKTEVTKYCFYYGWIFPDTSNEKDLYLRGLIIINKLKKFGIHNFIEDTDEITQFSKYYEWRKLIWMRLSYLIKEIDSNYIVKKINEFDFDGFR